MRTKKITITGISLLVLCCIACISESYYLLHPIAAWWDSGIYIGVGKYIFSHGQHGYLEIFRPPLFPIFLGLVWKLRLDPVFWGTLLNIFSSISCLILTFLIAEKVRKNSGIISACMMSFMLVFFSFSVIPLTDTPSLALGILGIWLLLEKKYALSGFAIFLSFLTRFPMALLLVPAVLYALVENNSSLPIKTRFKNSLATAFAFIIPCLAYLLINALIYHNPLLPIIAGEVSVAASGSYNYDIFYYITNTFIENPLIIFGLVSLIPFFRKPKETFRSPLALILACWLIMIAYFTHIAHKEVRYAIAFLPFMIIPASYGIMVVIENIFSYFKFNKEKFFLPVILIISAGIACALLVFTFQLAPNGWLAKSPASLTAYYDFFKDKSNSAVLSPSPQIAMYSDAKLYMFDDWQTLSSFYSSNKSLYNYIAIDTCQVRTPDTPEEETSVLTKLETETKLVFRATTGTYPGACELYIFKAT